MKRKIAECINVRINVGNYQHIELTKYAEEEIEFSDKAELVSKEDSLRNDLLASLERSLKAIPERLGKGVEQAIEVEESIKKAIPSWLENSPIPNIANGAIKKDIQVSAEQKNQKDVTAVDNSIEVPETKSNKSDKVDKSIEEESKELFDDSEPIETTEAPEAPENTDKSEKSSKDEEFDLFDEDDIFDNK